MARQVPSRSRRIDERVTLGAERSGGRRVRGAAAGAGGNCRERFDAADAGRCPATAGGEGDGSTAACRGVTGGVRAGRSGKAVPQRTTIKARRRFGPKRKMAKLSSR